MSNTNADFTTVLTKARQLGVGNATVMIALGGLRVTPPRPQFVGNDYRTEWRKNTNGAPHWELRRVRYSVWRDHDGRERWEPWYRSTNGAVLALIRRVWGGRFQVKIPATYGKDRCLGSFATIGAARDAVNKEVAWR